MKLFKTIILLMAVCCFNCNIIAQNTPNRISLPEGVEMKTITYAIKDGEKLQMDVYQKQQSVSPQPVMFFMFAGAFYAGERSSGDDVCYYLGELANRGITAIAIDYRLGWKDYLAQKPAEYSMIEKVLDAIQDTKQMQKTFDMPVEDLYSATNYVIEHAKELNIDSQKIMISGSSAGAMSVLRAEWFLKNNNPIADVLPEGFAYKAVLSYAGAIYSNTGIPHFAEAPAPTLFIHGKKDLVVRYKGVRFMKEGIFSSKLLAKEYKKNGYTYVFLSLKGAGHAEGCGGSLVKNFDDIWNFIQDYALGNNRESKEYTLKYAGKSAGDFSDLF